MRTSRGISTLMAFLAVILVFGSEAQAHQRAGYLVVNTGGSKLAYEAVFETLIVNWSLTQLRRSYDHLAYCQGAGCTKDRVLGDLKALTDTYEVVDLHLYVHGGTQIIGLENGFLTTADLAQMKPTWPRRHRLRALSSIACYGASMNSGFLGFGFDVSSGSRRIDVVGRAYGPMFAALWRERRCLFGPGDCSRTYEEAIRLAWATTSWMESLAPLFKVEDLDSSIEVVGDGSIKITTVDAVYNACNHKGDACGFMTPGDGCCLPGQTCEGVTYGCDGPEEQKPAIDQGLCRADALPAPTEACATGRTCPSGLCLADMHGQRCATSCGHGSPCGNDETCVRGFDLDGAVRGSFCAKQLSEGEKACICKDLTAVGCGVQNPGTCGAARFDPRAILDPGHEPPGDPTLIYAEPPAVNWLAQCGCPILADTAKTMCGCCDEPARGGGGCSTAGATDRPELLPWLLVLIALGSLRSRRRPGGRGERA